MALPFKIPSLPTILKPGAAIATAGASLGPDIVNLFRKSPQPGAPGGAGGTPMPSTPAVQPPTPRSSIPAANSVVDYLKGQGVRMTPGESLPYFSFRKNAYNQYGLDRILGEFTGKANQNTALLQKLQELGIPGYGQAATTGTPTMPTAPTQTPPIDNQAVIEETTPSNLPQNIYDTGLLDPNNNPEIGQLTSDFTGNLTRAADRIPREVAWMRGSTDAAKALAVAKGEGKASNIAERAAGFGGAGSGMTQAAGNAERADAEREALNLEMKFGRDLYGKLSQEEKQFGTNFLRSLSIPEAEQFTNLPAPVRGAVMASYEKAFGSAQNKANKEAQTVLNRLGYQFLPDGTLIRTLPRQRYEETTQPFIDEREQRKRDTGARAEEANQRAMSAEERAAEKYQYDVTQRPYEDNVVTTASSGDRVVIDKRTGRVIKNLGPSSRPPQGGGSGGALDELKALLEL